MSQHRKARLRKESNLLPYELWQPKQLMDGVDGQRFEQICTTRLKAPLVFLEGVVLVLLLAAGAVVVVVHH